RPFHRPRPRMRVTPPRSPAMHVPSRHAIALALAMPATGAALALCGAAAAQSTPAADPQRAETTTAIQVAPDVTLRTRVADPALPHASREFDPLDRDSSAFLDIGAAAAGTGLAAGFEAADGDGDGRIDRDEYTARIRR